MIDKNYIAEIMEGRLDDAKAKIIKAGLEVFSMSSLAVARTREIAAHAGVNHAAISYYFGGKKELYIEIANQIADFIAAFNQPYFEMAEKVFESGSPEDAKELIKDFVLSRVCEEHEMNDVFRQIILIINREELSQRADAFDIFYKKSFERSLLTLKRLVEIASRGEFEGVRACLVGEMIIGQVLILNSARNGFKKVNGWLVFGEDEIAQVKEMFYALVDRIFK